MRHEERERRRKEKKELNYQRNDWRNQYLIMFTLVAPFILSTSIGRSMYKSNFLFKMLHTRRTNKAYNIRRTDVVVLCWELSKIYWFTTFFKKNENEKRTLVTSHKVKPFSKDMSFFESSQVVDPWAWLRALLIYNIKGNFHICIFTFSPRSYGLYITSSISVVPS